MTFHKGTSTEKLQIQTGSTQRHYLTPLHKRVYTKQRKKNTTWWSLGSQTISWWSQRITNKTPLTNKIL